MIGAFVNSANWIHLTSVQMARNRSDDFGRGGSSGALGRHRSGEGGYGGHPRQPRLMLFFILLIIVLLGLGLLVGIRSCVSSLNTRLQKYMPLTETAEVVELTIQQTRAKHQLNVSLTLVDADGYSKTESKLIQGDKVQLEDEYIIVPGRLDFLGLHSGYMLTELKGYYNTGTSSGSSLILNKADSDNSIQSRIISPIVSSKFASIFILPSRSVYKICITPAGQLTKEC